MGASHRHGFALIGAQGSLALIAATSVSAGTPAGITTAATRAVSTSTATSRFLGTRFVHLELPAIHIEAVEISNGLGCIASITEFDKSEAARAPSFPVGDNSSRRHLIAFVDEQLLKGFIVHAE